MRRVSPSVTKTNTYINALSIQHGLPVTQPQGFGVFVLKHIIPPLFLPIRSYIPSSVLKHTPVRRDISSLSARQRRICVIGPVAFASTVWWIFWRACGRLLYRRCKDKRKTREEWKNGEGGLEVAINRVGWGCVCVCWGWGVPCDDKSSSRLIYLACSHHYPVSETAN